VDWGFAPCGISATTGCRRTSSAASSPTSCGRPSNSGSGAPGWVRARGQSSANWNAFRALTSCCRLTEDGRELRLRCVVRPDAAQAALLDRLGLDLPERLRIRSPALERASV